MYILDQKENICIPRVVCPQGQYIKAGCKGFTLHGNVYVMLISEKSDAIF